MIVLRCRAALGVAIIVYMNEKRVALLFTLTEWAEIFSAIQTRVSSELCETGDDHELTPILRRIEAMLRGETSGQGH
jgi:hypothetical protein